LFALTQLLELVRLLRFLLQQGDVCERARPHRLLRDGLLLLRRRELLEAGRAVVAVSLVVVSIAGRPKAIIYFCAILEGLAHHCEQIFALARIRREFAQLRALMRFTIKFGAAGQRSLHDGHGLAQLVVGDDAVAVVQMVSAFVHIRVLLDEVEQLRRLLLHRLERRGALDHLAERRGIFTAQVLAVHGH
jgi:hypothetical protein